MPDGNDLGPWPPWPEAAGLEVEKWLLETAARSLEAAFEGAGGDPDSGSAPAWLRQPGASFVTLERGGVLRGCMGSIEPRASLFEDLWENARAAAFRDPRFLPLARRELDGLELAVSVLGPREKLRPACLEELCAILRPGRDGLLVAEGGRRATFLPAVWKQLPDPEQFVQGLWRKAGLAPGHWSEALALERYGTWTVRGRLRRAETGKLTVETCPAG